MKISYRVTGAGGAYTVLFDDSTGGAMLVSPFNPHTRPTPDEAPVFESNAQFRKPRQNVVTDISFTVNIDHGTSAAALEAVYTRAQLVLLSLNLKQEGATNVQYYPNGLLVDYSANVTGQSVEHSFQFRTDLVTETEPA